MKNLFHYYEKGKQPFQCVTSLPFDEAIVVLKEIQLHNPALVSPNIEKYLIKRYEREAIARDAFISIGGKPQTRNPVYFTLEESKNMATWFKHPETIRLPLSKFDLQTVSFTYGDLMTVFNPKLKNGDEWWGKVFTYSEICEIIKKHGWPKQYGLHDAPKGESILHFQKYIEAQVWCTPSSINSLL